jgi:xylose isomerase
MAEVFPGGAEVRFAGAASEDTLAYRFYDAERLVLDKTMKQQLRFAVCYWHTFCWTGQDVFGAPTFARPWFGGDDEMEAARRKGSVELDDLFYAHVGAIDTLALALLHAAQLFEDATLTRFIDRRYAGRDSQWGRQIVNGETTLAALSERCLAEGLDPKPRSGRQEQLEGINNRVLHPDHL